MWARKRVDNMNKMIFLTGVMALLMAGCEQQVEAPFGFKWGMRMSHFPVSQLLTVNIIPLNDDETMIFSTTVPEGGVGEGSYRFYFVKNKLDRIVFNTFDITGENAVEQSKNVYIKLRDELTKKYGAPIEVDERIYLESFDFFPCVTNKNCGSWKTTFDNKTTNAVVFIGMGLNGDNYKNDRIVGRVSIEFRPSK